MKKVISKGYTLEVKSWENDGDYPKTKNKVVQTEEKARLLTIMCNELFCSNNNGGGGIGNLCCDYDDAEGKEIILAFVEDNEKEFYKVYPQVKGVDEDDIVDLVLDIAGDLMGCSEFYFCRVCESVTVTHSEEDVFLNTVTF